MNNTVTKLLTAGTLGVVLATQFGCATVASQGGRGADTLEGISASDNKVEAAKKAGTGLFNSVVGVFKSRGDQAMRIFNNFRGADGKDAIADKAEIFKIQKALKKAGYEGADGKELVVDGSLGVDPENSNTIFAYQNFNENNGGKVDFSSTAIEAVVEANAEKSAPAVKANGDAPTQMPAPGE